MDSTIHFHEDEIEKRRKHVLLMFCKEHNIPVRVIGDSSVHTETARTIVRILYDDHYAFAKKRKTNFFDIDVWKICNSKLILSPKFRWALEALTYNVHIVDEIDNADYYDEEILFLVAKAAFYGSNICHLIKPGVTVDELRKRVYNIAMANKACQNMSFEEAMTLYYNPPY